MITESECRKIKVGDFVQIETFPEIKATALKIGAPIFSMVGGECIGRPIHVVPKMYDYLGKTYKVVRVCDDVSYQEDTLRFYLDGPDGIEEFFFNRYMMASDQGITEEKTKKFNEGFLELF